MSQSILEKDMIAEEAAFRDVIKELVSKDNSAAIELEERIKAIMRTKALSKGWNRSSGAKVAPLTLLNSLSK